MQQRTKQIIVLALASSVMQVQAQSANSGIIEEVVVTAQKREESLQEIPIAMSAYDTTALEARSIVDFAGLSAAVPSLNYTPYPSSSEALIMYMRGQGANDVGQITREGAVGVYIDGVYLARPQLISMDLADVERIEVLRGPQGSLYGRNTTGGAVNIHSRKPSGEFAFKQQLGLGNRGHIRSLSVVDLPEWNGLSAKISALHSERDGYVSNAGAGNDYGEQSQDGARLALRWTVSDSIVVDYSYDLGDLNATPIYYQNDTLVSPRYSAAPHSRSARTADLPDSDTDFEGHTLTLAFDLNEDTTLKLIGGYRELDTQYYQDYLDAAFVYSYYKSADDIESRQFSQEVQLLGQALDGRLEYVAGLYYFEESARHAQLLQLLDLADDFDPGNAVPQPFMMQYGRYVDTRNRSRAAYLQATYTPQWFEQRFSATVGARYTDDDRAGVRQSWATIVDFDMDIPINVDVRNQVSNQSFDPMLTLNMQWNDDLSTYAKMATAYKAGGFAEAAADFTLAFAPEEVTSFELGLKSYALDRRMRLNIAAFISDYEDMQLDLSPDPSRIQVVNTYNAGTAEITGIELDYLLQVNEQLSLRLDYAFLDWTIDEVLHPVIGADVTAEFSLPYAPKHAYTVGLDYHVPMSDGMALDFTLDYAWQDKSYMSSGTTSSPAMRALWQRDDFGLLNSRLTATLNNVAGGELRVALWAKNLLDEDYHAHRFTAGIGGAVAWAEPRTIGLDLIYEYH